MPTIKKLYKNTLIYSIGNFGSRIINFILLPLYTFYISASDYGEYDLIITIIAIVIPIITLQLPESILKFAKEKSKTIKNTLFLLAFILFFVDILLLLLYFYFENLLIILIMLLVSVQISDNLLRQYSRLLSKNWIYALSGILTTFITSLTSFLFVVYIRLGISGILIGQILGETVSLFFLLYHLKIYTYIKGVKIDKEYIKRMLKFSIPLVPCSLIWWVMNSSDRFFIINYLDLSSNGLYSIAYKIPTLFTVIYGYYNLAWQEEVLINNKSSLYGSYFRELILFLCSSFPILLNLSKVYITGFMNNEYYDAYLYVPIIMLAMIFYCLSSFIGVMYRKNFNTKKEMSSSIFGAIINIVINALLINIIGLWAVSISTLLSFIVVFIYRYHDTGVYFKNDKNNAFLALYVVLSCIIYYINNNIFQYITLFMYSIIFVILNRKFLSPIIRKIVKI